jgi:hypothetical protein
MIRRRKGLYTYSADLQLDRAVERAVKITLAIAVSLGVLRKQAGVQLNIEMAFRI